MILIALAAAATVQDCNHASNAAAKEECFLNQSLALDNDDHFDCRARETQSNMNVCSYRDYLRADIELNRTWHAVSKRVTKDPSAFRSLLDAQRSWLTYRDKQCDVWSKWYEGGTIVPLMVNSCLTEITKFRTKELGQLLEDN